MNKGPHEVGPVKLEDGLYRVTTGYLCAGFVIEGGHLIACADILGPKFHYWATIAVRISP